MRIIRVIQDNNFIADCGVIAEKTSSEVVRKMMAQNANSNIKTEMDFIRFIIATIWGTPVCLPTDPNEACEKFLLHLEEFGIIEKIS